MKLTKEDIEQFKNCILDATYPFIHDSVFLTYEYIESVINPIFKKIDNDFHIKVKRIKRDYDINLNIIDENNNNIANVIIEGNKIYILECLMDYYIKIIDIFNKLNYEVQNDRNM